MGIQKGLTSPFQDVFAKGCLGSIAVLWGPKSSDPMSVLDIAVAGAFF